MLRCRVITFMQSKISRANSSNRPLTDILFLCRMARAQHCTVFEIECLPTDIKIATDDGVRLFIRWTIIWSNAINLGNDRKNHAPAPYRVNDRIIVSDTTESGATYAIDGLLLETENNNQPSTSLLQYSTTLLQIHGRCNQISGDNYFAHTRYKHCITSQWPLKSTF